MIDFDNEGVTEFGLNNSKAPVAVVFDANGAAMDIRGASGANKGLGKRTTNTNEAVVHVLKKGFAPGM